MDRLKWFVAVIAALFGYSICTSQTNYPTSDDEWQERFWQEYYRTNTGREERSDNRFDSPLIRLILSKYSPDAIFETKDNKYFQLVRPSINGAAFYTDVGSFISGVKFQKRKLAIVLILVPRVTSVGFEFGQPPQATSQASAGEVAVTVNAALTNAGFAKVIFLAKEYGHFGGLEELYTKGLPSQNENLRDKEFELRENTRVMVPTVGHMWSLQDMVFRAQSIDPEAFSLVQTGIVMTSTSLPPPIRDTPVRETQISRFESNKLIDPWQQPYYLILSKRPSGASEFVYELKVWSAGENRSNEMGKGDDILTTYTNR